MEISTYNQSASATRSPGAPIPGAEFLHLVEHSNEQQLTDLLHRIQHRLGTAGEQPGDFEHARIVAHELNNLITINRLNHVLHDLVPNGAPSIA